MRSVSITGTGIIRFGRHYGRNPSQLASAAITEALTEAGHDRKSIQGLFCGTVAAGFLAAQRIARDCGLTGVEAINFENACCSSATAFRYAWMAVASGEMDRAVVVGVDQLSVLGGGTLPLGDEDVESANGLTMPSLYAMRAQRYAVEHDLTPTDLASIAVKARKHGLLNPYAQVRKAMTVEEILAARPVADPLTVAQCCPIGDGAAAVVIEASENVSESVGRVKVLASHLTSGRYMQGSRDMTSPEITVRCASETYEQFGIDPADIDVVECHDAFTIAELLYYEALGFAKKGEGVALVRDEETSIGGRIPFNPSGGLLCRGHPVGASGVAQMVELTRQLQGRCGQRQVEGAKRALAHITGGGIFGFDHGACAIHVLGV
jgi:benzoylsuccinyl-CoA thiolase BbsB subunit